MIKRQFKILISIFVLFGLANCIIIEPSLAFTHDEAQCTSSSEHCCLICNSTQHQWNTSPGLALNAPLEVRIHFAAVEISTYSYCIPDSVFHPPPFSLRI